MRLKLKRMVALLLAVCVMASTAAPVFAADEPLLEQPPVTAEEVAGELTLPGEVPAATETPKATEVPAATEEPVVTEMPAATEAPEMTEVPEATEEPVATEVPAATEAPEATETPAPTKTPEGNEVPVAEDGADKLAQAKRLRLRSRALNCILAIPSIPPGSTSWWLRISGRGKMAFMRCTSAQMAHPPVPEP